MTRGPAALCLLLPALLACEPAGGRSLAERAPAPGDTTFAALVAALSEPGGHFDTDNLISNEASYLHVMGALDSAGVRGGAYIGVGPDQNFSYVAAVRPAIAFMVDIRRDNMLQHLWFRSLFEAAPTRLDYVCLMVARSCGGASSDLDAAELVARVDGAGPAAPAGAVIERAVARAAAYGVPLDGADSAAIRSIHERFAAAGLDLRFNTHGRAPRWYYPTLRDLILERDLAGRWAGYLASDSAYDVVRALQAEGRLIPVVGDLAGGHAVRAIGELARRRGLTISAFYVSNVEFYLFGDGTYAPFVRNLQSLPVDRRSVLIRSVFRAPAGIPGARPGYASAQLLHGIPALLRQWEQGRIRGYGDLVAAGFSD